MAQIVPYDWRPGAEVLPPSGGAVRLAIADLDDPGWDAAELAVLLSPEERERAARLASDVLRRRFAVRRGLLRRLLGGALGRDPASLTLIAGERGKPELAPSASSPRLRFNLADSGPLALYGLTFEGPIGVDLETPAPASDLAAVARRWFSRAEQAALAQLPEGQRLLGFYRCWTRKEALVKAAGGGVAMGLDRFTVSLGPGEPARLLHSELPELLGFELLDVAGPHLAACAVARGR